MTSPYAPPQTLTPEQIGTRFDVAIPGVSAKVVVLRDGAVGKRDLLVDGHPAPKKFLGKRLLKNDAGEEVVARIVEGLTGTTLVIGKDKYPIGPHVSAGLGLLAFLPFICIVGGGAIGGFFGAVGMIGNRKLAHSSVTVPLKIAGMLGVTLLTVLVVLIVAGAVHNAINS